MCPGSGSAAMLCLLCVVGLAGLCDGQQSAETQACLLDNTAGCHMGRPPIYMVSAPRKVHAGQVVQVFATILRMEYGRDQHINVRVSITQGRYELAFTEALFERPSSRVMQLLVPENTPAGKYRLRLEGTVDQSTFGLIFSNETDIEFSTKRVSLFIQTNRRLFRQGQRVHFRIIPVLPNLMPKTGSMTVYVDDPNGVPVRRWYLVQTNAGGVVSEAFDLADQPTYGTWSIRVQAFGHEYHHEFYVEEFWTPRFDVNVSVPHYFIENSTEYISGIVVANHSSGFFCKGNASITAFFMPREEVWNYTRGWLQAYERLPPELRPTEPPEYFPLSAVSPKDYHMYLEYDYRFVDHFHASFDFAWSWDQIRDLAQRAGDSQTIVGSSIMFFANVTDWYTSLNRTGWASTMIFDSRVALRLIGDSVRSFKPLAALHVQVAVMRSDGTPADDHRPVMFEVLMSNIGTGGLAPTPPVSIFTVNGVAEHEVLPGEDTQHITVRASYFDGDESERHSFTSYGTGTFQNDKLSVVEMRANRYYSPTKNYVTIRTSTANPRVNEYMIFHIKTSHFVPQVFYQVLAQSNIIIGDVLEMTSKQKTFATALSREMVPTARIVVYYLRQPEEIVSDVLNFFVNGFHQNEVDLTVHLAKDFSQGYGEMNAFADPGSYVAFSGMLLDHYLMGLSEGITETRLIDELETYGQPARGTYKQLWRTGDVAFDYQFFPSGDFGIDTNTSFHDAGLVVLTDADLTRIPNLELCPEGTLRCLSDSNTEACYPVELKCNGQFDVCDDGSDEFGCNYDNHTVKKFRPLNQMSRHSRHFDNTTWTWQEIFTKPNGRVDFMVPLPSFPLWWVISGLSISHNLGLGIMRSDYFYDGTGPFYTVVEHPDVIVRGEQVGVRVSIFSKWFGDDYLEVLVTLHASDDVEFVMVEEMGFVRSYDPRTHKKDHQTIVFVEPGEARVLYLPIVPAKHIIRGEITFTVSSTTFMMQSEYTGTIQVIPDGVTNYYHIPYLVDLTRYASLDIPDFKVPVQEFFFVPGALRFNLYVSGSATACVSAFGDVVTPGFFEDYLNAENILYRPYGGGEMIVFNFAYNALTLRFMKTSEQLSNERLAIALDELNLVFQRMLSYMNPEEGSFKMFRDDDASSLWLTAFAAKTLQLVRFGEWERQIFIPVELLNKMVLYICSRQNSTTGAFIPDDQPAYDYKMSSLETGSQGRKMTHPVPLTAYVLIALYQLPDVTEAAAKCRNNAERLAQNWLADQVADIPDSEVFHLAITAYALSYGSKGRVESFNRLFALMRNESDHLYFADQKVWENPSDFVTNIRYLLPRQELLNDAYAVQTTAYALLTYIKQRSPDVNTTSFMKWINTMRNTVGGFSSTQDTVVAMEALFEFTRQDKHRNKFYLDLNIWSTSSPGWKKESAFRKDFYSRRTYDCIPSVWGAIRSNVQGVGRALLQLTTTKNVEYDFLIKKPQKVDMSDNSFQDGFEQTAERIKFFDLMIDKLLWHGRNFSVMEMWPCVTWLYTERGLTTGLSVLEIDIPTGFIVMNNTLRDYVRSRVVPSLKRAEFYGRKVVFYFSYLDTSKTCVHFRADRWYPVANVSIQYRIRVYDYYEPGMHNTTLYTTFNLFQQNVCYCCGSYQCPYCPYFNVASVLKASSLLIATVLCIMLLRYFLHS